MRRWNENVAVIVEKFPWEVKNKQPVITPNVNRNLKVRLTRIKRCIHDKDLQVSCGQPVTLVNLISEINRYCFTFDQLSSCLALSLKHFRLLIVLFIF